MLFCLHSPRRVVQGETILNVPPVFVADRQMREKDRVHLIENAVVSWSRQIKVRARAL